MKKLFKLLLVGLVAISALFAMVGCGAPDTEKVKPKLEEQGLTVAILTDVANDQLSLNMQAILSTHVPSYYNNDNIVDALVACDITNISRFAIIVNFDDADAAKKALEYIETNLDVEAKRSGKSLFVASTTSLMKVID